MEFFDLKIKNIETEENSPVNKEEAQRIQESAEEIFERIIDRLDQKIGEGNSADVYIDSEYPETCFKIIRYGGTEESRVNSPEEEADFLTEARSLETNVHVPFPFFIASAEYQRDDGEVRKVRGLIMERIHGSNLEEIIKREVDMPEAFEDPKHVRTFFSRIHDFLRVLNKGGVYHRDLALRNIMVDENGEPWIIDFGKSEKRREFEEERPDFSDQDTLRNAQGSFTRFYRGKKG